MVSGDGRQHRAVGRREAADCGRRLRAAGRTALFVVLLVATTPVPAQSSRSGDSTARLQQAVQQLTNEKARLQADNAKLEREAEELRKENERLSEELDSASSRLERTKSSNENLTTTLDSARERLDELVAKYRELAEEYRATEIELARISGELETRNQEFLSCAKGNDELAGIALDALDRYENKGCFGRLAQVEPFTGIKRARIENLVDEYEYRVESLRMDEDAGTESAAD